MFESWIFCYDNFLSNHVLQQLSHRRFNGNYLENFILFEQVYADVKFCGKTNLVM